MYLVDFLKLRSFRQGQESSSLWNHWWLQRRDLPSNELFERLSFGIGTKASRLASSFPEQGICKHIDKLLSF